MNRENLVKSFNGFLSLVLLLCIAVTLAHVVFAAAPNPGHNFTSIGGGAAQGDLIYGSAVDTLSALPKDANATRYLSNTGTSNNPAWAQVNLADGVTGDLPFANLTQGSALSVLGVTGNATADNASIAAGSDHQVLRRSGTALGFGSINLAQSAAVTGILPTANGGTGMAFFTAAGPTVARTYTFPDANSTVLTSNAAVTVAQGGTGVTTLGDAGVLIGNGTGAVAVSGAGTAGQVFTSNGAGVDPTFQNAGGGSGYRTKVTLGSDVTNNNATLNTLADCTGLSFAVTSGTRYGFQALIWYTAAATTTGSRWTLNGPAFTNLTYRSVYTLTATTVTTNNATAYSIPAASNASSLTAGNLAQIDGTILPSANGTLVVRFASEIASSAIVCKAGSSIEYWTM